jgi:hypothetical protein
MLPSEESVKHLIRMACGVLHSEVHQFPYQVQDIVLSDVLDNVCMDLCMHTLTTSFSLATRV